MKLAKPILVTFLAFAVAVLFPMRKAHAALARAHATSTAVASPRPPARRRVSGPQLVLKREPTGHQTPNIAAALTTASAAPAPGAAPSARGADAQSTPQTHAPAATADCDSIVDRTDYALRPQPTGTARPTTHLVVNARYVDDIPKPPPKTAAL